MKNIKFANRLALLRKKQGLTQKEFADCFSEFTFKEKPISPLTISSWENGSKCPPIQTLVFIASFFRTSTDYLLGLTDSYKEVSSHDTINNSPNIRTPEILIQNEDLAAYHEQPVFVVFENKQHHNQWGMLDFEKKRVVFTNMLYPLTRNLTFYTFVPIEYKVINAKHYKPLTYNQMYAASTVYIEMLSTDGFIRGQYNGRYKHNENKSCLIKSNGLTLPYDGIGISYNAFTEDLI